MGGPLSGDWVHEESEQESASCVQSPGLGLLLGVMSGWHSGYTEHSFHYYLQSRLTINLKGGHSSH